MIPRHIGTRATRKLYGYGPWTRELEAFVTASALFPIFLSFSFFFFFLFSFLSFRKRSR